MTYTDTEEIQGLFPPGWHIPSEPDWETLFNNWANNAFAGAPLKYSGYSGFNASLNGVVFFNTAFPHSSRALPNSIPAVTYPDHLCLSVMLLLYRRTPRITPSAKRSLSI
jgi:hypothetical protein